MAGRQSPVLYLGDDGLQGAAAYLAGVMAHAGIRYDYLPSESPAGEGLLAAERRLVVLSDYPARNLSREQMAGLAERVRSGLGLLMIGGWSSFQGANGGYAGTPIEELLPVALSAADDRLNWPFPCLLCKHQEHPILAGLPFDRPPSVGGYNRVVVKEGAELLLWGVRYRTEAAGGICRFVEEGRDPLLVVWEQGRGRAAAFASDVAPHWVGGLVDWGERRVRAGAAGSEVEVGEHYARFFVNLLGWTGRL
jgi:hypothetical protein